MLSSCDISGSSWPRLVFLFPTWEVNGVSTVQCLLAEGLAEMGCQCEIVGTDLNQDEPPTEMIPQGVRHRRLVPQPLARTVLGMRRPAVARARRIIDRELRRQLDDGKPVVLVPGFEMCWSLWPQGLPRNVRLLCHIQSDDPWWYEAALIMAQHTSSLIAVSRRVQEGLEQELQSWKGKVEWIPNAVNCPAAPPIQLRRSSNPLRLLYVGRLVEKQKRISRIPRLLQALEQRDVPFQMEIAGEGPEEAKLREACHRWIQSGDVVFLGKLNAVQVREACRRADVFVLLSDYEGMPLAMLEAMSEGCIPLVSKNLSGVEEVVSDGRNGLVHEADAHEAQAISLEHLWPNPTLMSALRREAWATIALGPYSVQQMIASYFRLIISKPSAIDDGITVGCSKITHRQKAIAS